MEQPVEKYKSRYLSEGKKHGELLGRNACAQTKKSYPKLQVCAFSHHYCESRPIYLLSKAKIWRDAKQKCNFKTC